MPNCGVRGDLLHLQVIPLSHYLPQISALNPPPIKTVIIEISSKKTSFMDGGRYRDVLRLRGHLQAQILLLVPAAKPFRL